MAALGTSRGHDEERRIRRLHVTGRDCCSFSSVSVVTSSSIVAVMGKISDFCDKNTLVMTSLCGHELDPLLRDEDAQSVNLRFDVFVSVFQKLTIWRSIDDLNSWKTTWRNDSKRQNKGTHSKNCSGRSFRYQEYVLFTWFDQKGLTRDLALVFRESGWEDDICVCVSVCVSPAGFLNDIESILFALSKSLWEFMTCARNCVHLLWCSLRCNYIRFKLEKKKASAVSGTRPVPFGSLDCRVAS